MSGPLPAPAPRAGAAPDPSATASPPGAGPADAAPQPAPTAPGRRASARRTALGWVLFGVALLLLAALVSAFATRDWTRRPPLDPAGPGADGARAIVSILRDQGVTVTPTTRRDETRAAVDAGTTLVVTDPGALGDDTLRGLVDAAGAAVLLEPRTSTVDLFAPGARYAGFGEQPTAPACDLPAARAAGEILPGRAFTAPAGVSGCYPVGDGHALLAVPRDDAGEVVLLDGAALFDNEHLAEGGNAALALGLLGTRAEVVWYVPALDDADDVAAPPTLGDLVPPWVTPAIVLLLAAGLAAAVWRGRRMGPLVAERLPVTVRGSETLEGRARLYARAGDPAHAAAALRAGSASRMARRLGLPATATLDEVADAAAVRLALPPAAVRDILLAAPPSDAALVRFGERLRDLEDAVDAASGPAA